MARRKVSRHHTAHEARHKAHKARHHAVAKKAKRAKDTHFGKRGATHVKTVNAPKAW